MALQGSLLSAIVLLLLLGFGFTNGIAKSDNLPAQYDTAFLNRTSFPAGFTFGTASSSYQYEGAAKEDGRGPSIWDSYTHRYPEKIKDGSNGDIANDEYHRYKEDVGIMKNMGLDAYRFSISWSRLLPNGKLSGGVNKKGVKYYNNLIDELLRNGIKPFVTLFHWDLPQTLEDEYGGFLSPRIVNHFRDYAELCYKEFGDRVKHWITFNEPYSYSAGGYAVAILAPGRCSEWQQLNCTGGDSGTEPYLVSHHQLLAHAAAVKLYKQKYQLSQKGLIGITLVSNWFVPVSEAKHHKNAALRALDYMLGWFMDPLTNGDYPHSMRTLVGNRLPKFTKAQSKLLIGSFDFLGLNYYTANYAAYAPQHNSVNASYLTDARASLTSVLNGIPIGPKAASDWLYVYPRGIRDLLLYTKTKYNNPLIYITENGIDEFNDPKLTLEQALNDTQRVDYYYRHLDYLQRAIKKKQLYLNMEELQGMLLFGLLLILGALRINEATFNSTQCDDASLHRSCFPAGFIFGTASASYQYEGAAKEGGRGPSIWDTYTHKHPEKIVDHSSGDVAIDQYHRYKEDVRIMKNLGFDAYRLSFSWSRLLPDGKLSGGVNKEGIEYYNNLIDELQTKGVKPFVTLFHWDLPQALEDEYRGFLSPKIINHFQDYAELCFKEFGDRVEHWITLNEPHSYSRNGYATGKFAPGRCSAWQKRNCTGGNSGTEPYMAAHYQLLAHAAAVKLYRHKYQVKQKGVIGITTNSHWFVPYSKSKQDKAAALRALDSMFGWYMSPLTNGDYPSSMRSLVGKRLPEFTKNQSEMVKGSFDFLGLNYYTGYYAANLPIGNAKKPSYTTDSLANLTAVRNGIPIGTPAASDWLHFYPQGFSKLLQYTKKKYNNPVIYITENGWDDHNDPKLTLREALDDKLRIEYFKRHLDELRKAIKDGVKVKGYFAWSLFDNFEWADGYSCRFGINFVDYKNGLKRHPKRSAAWFKKFLQN